MEELNLDNLFPSGPLSDNIKLAIRVEDALKFKVRMKDLLVLGLDGKLHQPESFIQLHESHNKVVVRFGVKQEQEYLFIRKNLDDFVFSTVSAEEIHHKSTFNTLMELKTNLQPGVLTVVQEENLNDMIRSIHLALKVMETRK